MIQTSGNELYLISYFFNSVLSLFLGCLSLSKNVTSRVHQWWFLLCICVAIWSFMAVISFTHSDYEFSLFCSRVANIAAACLPFTFIAFCMTMTSQSKRTQLLFLIPGALITALVFIFGFTDKYVSHMVDGLNDFTFFPAPGPIYHIFTAEFMIYVITSEYFLIKHLKTLQDPIKKNQIKYMALGTAIGFIEGASTFLPVYGINIDPWLSNFVWIYAAIISYAIMKYQLLDISILYRKTLLYSLLVSLTTLIYFSFVLSIGTIFQDSSTGSSFFYTFSIFAIIGILFKPLENLLGKIIDKFVFKKSTEEIEAENLRLLGELQKQDKLQAISTFAAGMAHEIKNPLTSIKTFAEHIDTHYENASFRESFRKIIPKEVERINDIVTQLLSFSKPRALALENTDICRISDETTSMLTNEFLGKSIRLQKYYSDPIFANVDPHQIKQVFLNVLLNALRATPPNGSVHIAISETPDHQWIDISIKDTGPGISKKNLKNIFDPFFTTDIKKGTGLGLTVVHRIIEEHSGKIEVRSEEGEGAEFVIRLRRLHSHRKA